METTLDLAPAQRWVAEMQNARDHQANICAYMKHDGREGTVLLYDDAAAKYQLIDKAITDAHESIQKAINAGTLTATKLKEILAHYTTIDGMYHQGGDSNA
jgi:hypothetical protein